MKKLIYTLLFAITFSFAGSAFSGFQAVAPTPTENGGFKGPSNGITTVSEALKAKDDALVILTGKIERETSKDKYLFRDSTGAIIVEIDNEEWQGQTITPTDTVIIHGEVDKEIMGKTEIDVDKITKK